jgi:hypothetical protein
MLKNPNKNCSRKLKTKVFFVSSDMNLNFFDEAEAKQTFKKFPFKN